MTSFNIAVDYTQIYIVIGYLQLNIAVAIKTKKDLITDIYKKSVCLARLRYDANIFIDYFYLLLFENQD